MNVPGEHPPEGAGEPRRQPAGSSGHWLLSQQAMWTLRAVAGALVLYRTYVVLFTNQDWYENGWAPVWIVVFGLFLLQSFLRQRRRDAVAR
jgi:hypothetical protein